MKVLLILTLFMTSVIGFTPGVFEKITGNVTENRSGQAMHHVLIQVKGSALTTTTDAQGKYAIAAAVGDTLVFTQAGYVSVERVVLPDSSKINVGMEIDGNSGYGTLVNEVGLVGGKAEPTFMTASKMESSLMSKRPMVIGYRGIENQDSYTGVKDNGFMNTLKEPLSTFAADVDAASYSNVRRFIRQGQLPPKDAVRIEEMINYFAYDIAAPQGKAPVRVETELTEAPWNRAHQLLRVSLRGKDVPKADIPSSNFVFLIDVSGSMYSHNKLPLVKTALKMLVDQLRDNDKVSIVTYAGSAAVKLASTSGAEKMKIKDAIDQLDANGSTAGSDGIKKAYAIARSNFIKNGNNRVIMATDGDFNVGPSSKQDMEDLIVAESAHGISISVLGFGMGNYKDSKMEILADKGHGNYAYIDNISEARKAMIDEFGGTLFTIAKDVKIQVEFNPHFVQGYRLVGYENRLLEAEDFNNDQKMGGDMGVGHTVTALYELIPVGVKSDFAGDIDPLKYQTAERELPKAKNTTELATVKFRYKDIDAEKSKLQSHVVLPQLVPLSKASQNIQFASAVAELGMLLRNSSFKQGANFDELIARAKMAKGKDLEGYRAEFIGLAQDAKALVGTE